MKVKAYAKLNLSLNVNEKKNGFHLLDSVVCTVDVFDEISIQSRNDSLVQIDDNDFFGTENVAYKIARSFVECFSTKGVNLSVNKGIPFMSGMGGSSATAAATVVAMSKMFGITDYEKIVELCSKHGSDIAYLTKGGLATMQGKGEQLEYHQLQNTLYFVVVYFNCGLSTKLVFENFNVLSERQFANNKNLVDFLQKEDIVSARKEMQNHLQNSAYSVASEELKRDFEKLSAFARQNDIEFLMTGCGSAHFMLAKNEEEAILLKQKLCLQGFNAICCKSVGTGVEFDTNC